MGTFNGRIKQLEQEVGDGNLTGSVVVDQVYAKYQHEGLDLRHPRGGKAHYLRDPLYNGFNSWLRDISRVILEGGATRSMADAMEDLSMGVYREAPFEFGDLKASPHPTVEDDGQITYNRLPMMHRLTEEEIDIKYKLARITGLLID